VKTLGAKSRFAAEFFDPRPGGGEEPVDLGKA